MWFRRKDRLSDVPPHLRGSESPNGQKPAFYRIEYDMMQKGAVIERRGKRIRQFAVTVNMSTRVVTSGDIVDNETFEALVAAGAIQRPVGVSTETTVDPVDSVSVPSPETAGPIIDEE